MNKWFKYIFISLILMFIGFNRVGASKTCTYMDGDGCSASDNCVELTMNDNIATFKVIRWGGSSVNSEGASTVENYSTYADGKTPTKCPKFLGFKLDSDKTTKYNSTTSANGMLGFTGKIANKKKKLSGYTILSYYGNYDDEDDDGNTTTVTENPIDSCEDIGDTLELVKQVYTFLKYLVPVIIILFSLLDFAKVIISDEEKTYSNAWSKLIKRLIIGAVILILPALLSFVISISGVTNTYDIGDSNIFCIFE